jgi:pyridoxine 5-phosphate synthase
LINNIRLGVNIDHVATLRNARGGNHPEITKAAIIAENAGADLITVHVREDRRHVNEDDLKSILSVIKIPLNLEIAANSDMIAIANRHKPHSVCFVPENRKEITTEGGLDVRKYFNKLTKLVKEELDQDINVSLFIDPDKDQLIATKDIGINVVEFHTGAYSEAFCMQLNYMSELNKIKDAVQLANDLNINCHAGHGLNFDNVSLIASIPNIKELNIGHFLISDAIFNGLENSIFKMNKIIKESVI